MSQDFRADLHVDTLSLLAERGGGLAPRRTDFQVDSERCQMGRIDLLGTAIFTVDGHESPWEHCLSLLEARDRLHQDSREPSECHDDGSESRMLCHHGNCLCHVPRIHQNGPSE